MEIRTPVMTELQIRRQLRAEIERANGLRALAREWGISPSLISQAVTGKSPPGPSVLARLGITSTVTTTRRVVYTLAS